MFKCKVKYSPQHFLFFSVWEVSQYKLECVFTVDPYILRKTILNINYSLVRIFSFTSITSVNNWKKKKPQTQQANPNFIHRISAFQKNLVCHVHECFLLFSLTKIAYWLPWYYLYYCDQVWNNSSSPLSFCNTFRQN